MIKQLVASLLVRRSESASSDLALLEKRQSPTDPRNFNDSYYFTGHDETGTFLITRLGFRSSGETEVWFDLLIPGLGALRMPGEIFQSGPGISCGPLEYRCVEPGQGWRILYDGPLLLGARKKVQARLDLAYEGTMPVYNFKRDGDRGSIARSLAAETWSREWFMKLKDLSQVHYEQGGSLQGTLIVGKKTYRLNLRAMRDHSFGRRDWGVMDRHVWMAALMEDGSFVNISLVRYAFLSFLTAGYLAQGDEIVNVTGAGDFSHVPAGNPLGNPFTLPFDAGSRRRGLEIRCATTDVRDYRMGDIYTIHEGIADFTFNNMAGRGICEFGFNDNSR